MFNWTSNVRRVSKNRALENISWREGHIRDTSEDQTGSEIIPLTETF